MPKRSNDTITLGSGKVYLMPYTDVVPETETICTEANRLGYIKNGATLTYTETTYEEKDDLNLVSKIITTEESATFGFGLITWNGATLSKIIDRCVTTTSGNIRTTKIGGSGNAQGTYYCLCFHHEDKKDGDIWIRIVGRNTAGAALAFAKESGTAVSPTFTAMPSDENGTLIILDEEIDAA